MKYELKAEGTVKRDNLTYTKERPKGLCKNDLLPIILPLDEIARILDDLSSIGLVNSS